MRPMMLRTALCAWTMVAAVAAHAQAPTDYTQAKQRADADEASLPAATSQALRETQARVLQDAAAECATPNADTSPFVIVAELDTAGAVRRTWREGGTPLAICVQKQVNGKSLAPPPRAPFYTSFELSFTP